MPVEMVKTPAQKAEFSYLMPNEEVRGIGAPYATETDFATASKHFDMEKYPGVSVVVTQLPNPIYGKYIRLPEGSALTPGLAFATVDDDDSGLYLSSTGVVGMSINGTANMTWSATVIRELSTRVDITGQLRVGTGTSTTAAGEISAKTAGSTFDYVNNVVSITGGYFSVISGSEYARISSTLSFINSSAGDNILAIGPNAAGYYIHVSRESNATPGENSEICLDGAGAYAIPFVFGIRARGTYAALSKVLADDGLLEFDGRGYDGSANSGPRVDIKLAASADWAVGAHPTEIVFSVTPTASTTIGQVLKIGSEGSLYFGSAEDLQLTRNAAGILDLHRVAVGSAQLNVWNTRTGAADGEYLRFRWTSNISTLGTVSAGSGTARNLHIQGANGAYNGLIISSTENGGVALGPGTRATALPNGRASFNASNMTATSATHYELTFFGVILPGASSTCNVIEIGILPTINYASGGAGRVQLVRFAPTNTALPTGNNGAIVLASTASDGLGGQWFFNTSDETTNWEAGRFRFTSNVFTIQTSTAGTGTARNIQISSAALLDLQGAASSGIVLNDSGIDADTRIEGDTLPYMIFCDASAATENIALLASAAPGWGGMDIGLFVGNTSTAPTSDPTSGGFFYVESGALKWRGSSGTVTTLAPA